MKPLIKIKRRNGKVKEWRGLGAMTTVYLWTQPEGIEVILIAGDRKTLKSAFFQLCGPDAIFRVGKLRRVKITKL